jgi:hypothetical protein
MSVDLMLPAAEKITRQDSGEFVEFGPTFDDLARPSHEIVAIEKKIETVRKTSERGAPFTSANKDDPKLGARRRRLASRAGAAVSERKRRRAV